MARPSEYTEEIADKICSELASGRSLRSVCEDEGMPNRSTVFRWMRTIDEFRDHYARAKEESADAHADKIEEIAEGVLEGRYGHQESRVAIDALKWTAGKQKPKKYGDRVDANLTVEGQEEWLKRLLTDKES